MRISWLYLAKPVRARQRTGFDLAAVGRNGEVGNRGVLGFAGTVRHHAGVAGTVRHLDRVQRFRQRADLVDLDQHRIGQPSFDARGRGAGLVTNRSSPTSWTLSPDALGQRFQPSQSSSAMPSSIEMIG